MDLPSIVKNESLPSRTIDRIRDHDILLVVSLMLFAGLIASVGGISIHGIIILEPLFGLFIAAALGLGLAALLSVAIGSYLGLVVTSGDALFSVVQVLSFFLGGMIASALWIPSHHLHSWKHFPRNAVSTIHFVGVVGCAASATVVMLGLVNEIIGLRPLYAGILESMIGVGFAGVLFGGALVLTLRVVSSPTGQSVPISRKRRYVLALLGPLWLTLATIGSAGFHLGTAIPAWVFDRQGSGWVTTLLDETIFGIGAIRIQLLLGSFFLAMMVVILSSTIVTRVKTA